MTEPTGAADMRHPITIQRTFQASPAEVWERWTTREGLESWWGPERFKSTVQALELRVGGRLEIVMRTDDPEVIAFLEQAGQSTTSVEKITFTEVVPMARLAFVDRFDHVSGVEPYNVACKVTFELAPGGTKMTFTSEAMHDERWTQLASAGWSSSFDKLAREVERFSQPSTQAGG